ncbi:MAG: bis-aminopropyl spermidine synthase family protein [Candidatus Hodarchaeota archaeon]
MNENVKELEELFDLLIRGNYLPNDTVSFLSFINLLRLIKSSRKFTDCVKNSNLSFSSFLAILQFLQNVNVIKLNKQKRIKIQNNEIFNLLFQRPSKIKIFLKLIRNIPHKSYFLRHPRFLSKFNLLKLFKPNFKTSYYNYQFPCSLRTSLKRAHLIISNTQIKSQKALFIGDDDLISILCKFILPELPVYIVEIDGRITKLLKEIAKNYKFKDFKVFNYDFKEINEISELKDEKFSIIHIDPPYEEEELFTFLSIIGEILDDSIIQIYLNGLYDDNSQAIINEFITENELNISKWYKSFNSYPLKSLDQQFLKMLKKEIEFDTNFKFNERNLRKLEFTSDLLLIEKGLIIEYTEVEIEDH